MRFLVAHLGPESRTDPRALRSPGPQDRTHPPQDRADMHAGNLHSCTLQSAALQTVQRSGQNTSFKALIPCNAAQEFNLPAGLPVTPNQCFPLTIEKVMGRNGRFFPRGNGRLIGAMADLPR